MAYGTSFGNNNIAVSASGMYQYYFVNSTGWNTSEGTTNRNVRNWMLDGSMGPYPAVDTNHSPSTNAAFSIPRNKDRLFWVNLERASSTTIAAVFFESPFLVLDVSIPGWYSAGLSNNQNYLTINCTVNYPFPFTAWRVILHQVIQQLQFKIQISFLIVHMVELVFKILLLFMLYKN